jgi:alkylated DNA nucleotide flippase Atl1
LQNCTNYSARIETIGSTRLARQAGTILAHSATKTNTAVAAISSHGSLTLVS